MIRLEPYKIALANRALDARAWQAAIDSQHFLVRLELLDLQIGQGNFRVRLLDREIQLDIARPVVASILNREHSNLAMEWSHAVAARGTGDVESSVAAGLLTQAIAQATGGILYDAVLGPFRDYAEQKKAVDTMLAAIFDREDLLRSRYPGFNPGSSEEGPVVIVSRISPY